MILNNQDPVMPKAYMQNHLDCTMSGSTGIQSGLHLKGQPEPQPGLSENAKPNEIRKREQLKQRLTRLWAGGNKEISASGPTAEKSNRRRHRLRFWKNDREEPHSFDQPEQMRSWAPETDLSSNAEPFTISDYLAFGAASENTISSVSEANTVIHRPYQLEVDEGHEPMPYYSKLEDRNEKPKPVNSVPPALDIKKSWSRSSPCSTVASSSGAANTFSPVCAGFTPVTPVLYTESDSSGEKADGRLKSAWKPRTIIPASEKEMVFIDDNKQREIRLHFKPLPNTSQGLEELKISSYPPCSIEEFPQTEDPLFDIQRNDLTKDTVSPNSEVSLKTWEHIEDEIWFAKLLKEYCPVRLRRNKRMNFDSEEFRSMQADLTLRTLAEQELRGQDRKLIFRPSLSSGKSFFRSIFHFEEDEDVLDAMDHFILCNEGLIPLFRGSRPAVRKHFFRRWHNYDRDRIIVCEQLMEKWLEDKTYLAKLKEDRKRRQERRLLMESCEGNNDRLPPFSFFAKKLLVRLSGQRGRIGKPPRRGSKLLVFRKEPLFGIPYFEKKKQEAKTWLKELVLSI
ncbi:hypothetical protein HG536_0F03020 [Torulaspora globosa]|uniref:Uncharacterized protein n=1 Tax=Torulaspora globosa TaxID=48254 RepID=A0A7G3ZKE1_9SACH|nr:uncharacterized protein HG536_0F03020 [Torulaspora globosa]QLL33977.1 hypothetical protein HG536_0F03020 [Torulaspora globosa]